MANVFVFGSLSDLNKKIDDIEVSYKVNTSLFGRHAQGILVTTVCILCVRCIGAINEYVCVSSCMRWCI